MLRLPSAIFHRPEIALAYADYLVNDDSAASGLFIAAPRRTGKTTFLKEDLLPALQNNGFHLIYVDLWEDQNVEPGAAISRTLIAHIEQFKSPADGFINRFGGLNVSVPGFEFDVQTHHGKGKEHVLPSFAQMLEQLSIAAGKPLVLIVDEAQHALTTKEGVQAMFALKSARDSLNLHPSPNVGVRMVFTGSDRDKLAQLTATKDQPFFGALMVRDFPLLDMSFVRWFCEDRAAPTVDLDPDETFSFFKRTGCRPEILKNALSSLRLDPTIQAKDRPACFFDQARKALVQEMEALSVKIETLPPLACAILVAMAQQSALAPFGQASFAAYDEVLEKTLNEPDVNVSASSVQQAISLLRDEGLIWRANRGQYEIERPEIIDALETLGACRT